MESDKWRATIFIFLHFKKNDANDGDHVGNDNADDDDGDHCRAMVKRMLMMILLSALKQSIKLHSEADKSAVTSIRLWSAYSAVIVVMRMMRRRRRRML